MKFFKYILPSVVILAAIGSGLLIWQVYSDLTFIAYNAGAGPGKIVGTVQGAREGYEKGYQEGKKEGLSAKDTEVKIEDGVKGLGFLEVLEAQMKMTDYFSISENKDYALLYSKEIQVIFSYDMTKADVEIENDKEIVINMPPADVNIKIIDNSFEMIDEYSKSKNSGSRKDAETAWINSKVELEKNAKNNLKNDELLMTKAENNAKVQVTNLVKALNNDAKVECHFYERENDDDK